MTNAYDRILEDVKGEFLVDRASFIQKVLLLQYNNEKAWRGLVLDVMFPRDKVQTKFGNWNDSFSGNQGSCSDYRVNTVKGVYTPLSVDEKDWIKYRQFLMSLWLILQDTNTEWWYFKDRSFSWQRNNTRKKSVKYWKIDLRKWKKISKNCRKWWHFFYSNESLFIQLRVKWCDKFVQPKY
jgi:hypothetical protein